MDLSKYQDPRVIEDILKNSKTIAVVGLSEDEERPSYNVARYLKEKGYKIIPVNPNYEEIFGEKCYNNLLEIPEKIDVVNIFRRPESVLPVINEAIDIKARAVWMQEGVINEDGARLASGSGIKVVMDRCMLKEHQKLF